MARTPRPGSVRYEPNIRGTYESVINTAEMRAYLRTVAADGVAIAKGIAADFTDTGHYLDSFRTEDGNYTGRSGDDRPEARIANDADYDASVEKRHQVLQKTGNAIEAKYGRRGGRKRH